jgi:hypothetical protein
MPLLNTHVPAGLWYAVPVAMAVIFLLLVAGLRRGPSSVLIGVSAWFALAVLLAALSAFATSYHRPAFPLAAGIVIPVLVGAALLRRPGALTRALDAVPLRSLIAVQLYRVIGGVFVIGWALGHIPALFALPAGIGDIAVGLAAPFVAARVADGSERSRRRAVWWNIDGIADLVLAVALGAATSPNNLWPTLLGHPNPLISRLPLVLIPVFAVPVAVLLHLASLRRLAQMRQEPSWAPLDASALGGRAEGSPAG